MALMDYTRTFLVRNTQFHNQCLNIVKYDDFNTIEYDLFIYDYSSMG